MLSVCFGDHGIDRQSVEKWTDSEAKSDALKAFDDFNAKFEK